MTPLRRLLFRIHFLLQQLLTDEGPPRGALFGVYSRELSRACRAPMSFAKILMLAFYRAATPVARL